MTLIVRPAATGDAVAIGQLGAEFVAYLRSVGSHEPRGITTAAYLRDGFGDRPAFAGLVAEIDRELVGYLLHHDAYDVDRDGRVVFIIELFVREQARRSGVGLRLMEEAQAICREKGANALVWTVSIHNAAAQAFYKQLGATGGEDLLMSLRV